MMYMQHRQSPVHSPSILSRLTSRSPIPHHRVMPQPRQQPSPNYYTNMPMYQYIRSLNGMNSGRNQQAAYVPPGGYPPSPYQQRQYYQPRPQVVYAAQPAPPPPPPQVPAQHLAYQQAQYNREYYNYYYNNYLNNRTSPVYAQPSTSPPVAPMETTQFNQQPVYYNEKSNSVQINAVPQPHYYQNHNDELLATKPPKNNSRSKKKSKYLLKDMWEEQEPVESEESKPVEQVVVKVTNSDDERIIQGYINNLENKKSENEEEEATVVEASNSEEEVEVKVEEKKKEERPPSRVKVVYEEKQSVVPDERVKDKLEIFEQVILNAIRAKKGSAGRVSNSRPESRQSDRQRVSPEAKLLSLTNPWSPDGQLDNTSPASVDDQAVDQLEKSMEPNSYEKWVERQLVNESKPDMINQSEDKLALESASQEKSSFVSSIRQKQATAEPSYGYKLYKLYQDEDGLFSLREI